MMTGIVVTWCGTFGFIQPDDGSADVFLRGRLFRVGDIVRFTPVPSERKPGQLVAVDPERIGEAPVAGGLTARPTSTNWKNFNSSSGSRRRAA